MKKLFTLFLLGCAAATANAQQINGDFDQWEDCYPWEKGAKTTTAQGTTPVGWTVSNVPMFKIAESVDEGEGKAARLYNYEMMGQSVPAYITLGTTWATAETKTSFPTLKTEVRNADGGSFGGVEFNYLPDGIKFRYKRDSSNGTERASVIAYMWTGSYTQTNVPSNTAVGFGSWGTAEKVKEMTDRDRNILGKKTATGDTPATPSQDFQLIASLEEYITEGKSEWATFEANFDYKTTDLSDLGATKLNVIISANDYFADRSTIVANNSLTIDDVELVYNSQLASLSYDGTAVENFDKDNYSYNIDAAYDESKLACTSNGKGATINKKDYNEETGVLTITVKGNDWSEENKNEHVYTIHFKTVTEYTNSLLVGLDAAGNISYTAPTEQTIQLIKEVDGSYSFFLADFSFGPMPVGDIKMTNLNRREDGNKVIYEQTQGLSLMNGSLEVTATLHAEEENGLMIANIDIPDAMASLGTPGVNVYVTFAPAITVNSTTNIADNLSGLYNVTIDRSFPAGWSTICLPFETTVAALGATQAQEFTAFADNVLTFDKVNNGNLAANTPYLIYFEEAKDLSAAPIYMPVEIESSTPGVVNHGDVTFTGNYTAGMSMVGLYGVAEQNGAQYIMKGGANSSLGSTSAYFTVAVAQTNAMRIQLEGGATAIDKVTTDGETFDIYTLGGVKVRENATGLNGLQKGIYIVNGKKVVVK